MPATPGDITVVYRAQGPDDVILREELDELARRRGAELHYVLGERDGELLSPSHLQELVPDIADRDVYVCGSPAMTAATRASLDSLRRPRPPHRHRALRLLTVRRVLAALLVTAVAVVLLARYETHPPRMLNPNSALRPRAEAAPAAAAATPRPGETSAVGPAIMTPFSVIQVRATLTRGRLTGVETVELTGDGPHTDALNARAEPLLRAAALEAGQRRHRRGHRGDVHQRELEGVAAGGDRRGAGERADAAHRST